MFVLGEESAEAIATADVEVGDLAGVGDRLGEWAQRSGIGNASMWPVRVVMPLMFSEGVQ